MGVVCLLAAGAAALMSARWIYDNSMDLWVLVTSLLGVLRLPPSSTTMPPKKRAASAKKAPPAKKPVRPPPVCLAALNVRRSQLACACSSPWSTCAQKTAPKKAASKTQASSAAADPLAGSAEWDPDTVTPAETNLGMQLTGKVALITGSGRGLGRAFAERLAALGCKVVIQGRNEEGPAQYGEGTTMTAVAEAVSKRYKVQTMKALADLTGASSPADSASLFVVTCGPHFCIICSLPPAFVADFRWNAASFRP